jgi:hypothetical protein
VSTSLRLVLSGSVRLCHVVNRDPHVCNCLLYDPCVCNCLLHDPYVCNCLLHDPYECNGLLHDPYVCNCFLNPFYNRLALLCTIIYRMYAIRIIRMQSQSSEFQPAHALTVGTQPSMDIIILFHYLYEFSKSKYNGIFKVAKCVLTCRRKWGNTCLT